MNATVLCAIAAFGRLTRPQQRYSFQLLRLLRPDRSALKIKATVDGGKAMGLSISLSGFAPSLITSRFSRVEAVQSRSNRTANSQITAPF